MEQTERKTALELANEKIFTKETLVELDELIGDIHKEGVTSKDRTLMTLGDIRSILKSHVELIDEELARR